MKKIITLLLLILLTSCKSKDLVDVRNLSNISGLSYTGWGVDPELVEKGQIPLAPLEKNWFYSNASGKALSRAVEMNSPTYMQTTCKLSAIKENQKRLYKEAVISANSKWNSLPDVEQKAFDLLSKEKTDSVLCKPTGDLGANYKTCECLIYVMFKGGKEELAKKLIN